MSCEAPEEGRMRPSDVSFTHRLLNTHVTALSVKENIVFVGEGQHCHAHDVASGRQVGSTQVFRAAVVHGLRIQPSPADGGSSWLLLLFGQKSLAVMLYHVAERKFFVVMEESNVEDWIVDAGIEKDLSHVVVATAHNTLLRCQIPNLAERCRNLTEQISGSDSSNSVPGQPHNSLNKMQSSHKTKKSRTVDTLSSIHKSGRNGDMTVVARAACVERCVLFSGHLVMMAGSWDSVVMMAGTMALQVMVWGPWGPMDTEGNALPLHCLLGHQGSIFSITFSPSQGLVATTSDDRSLRVWQVRHEADKPLPTSPEEEKEYWKSATITEKFAGYGHRARVWQSLILPSWLISVGEDSMVCVWEHSGALAASWRAHDGASIWSIAACDDPSDRLITGGSDGSVKSWCLSTAAPITAESMRDLPWSVCKPVLPNVHPRERKSPTESCSRVTMDAVDNAITSSNNKVDCDVPESHELFQDNPPGIQVPRKGKLPTERCPRVAIDSVDNSITSSNSIVDCDVPESHELFQDQSPGIPMPRKEPLVAATPDFPRCISLLGESTVLVVTNSGRLYSHNPETSWHLEYEDERLRNYAILEASLDSRRVALGTLTGIVIVLQVTEGGSVRPEMEVEGSSGKVFALQWLTMDRVLVLGTAGLMTTWEIQTQDKGSASPISTHHLPVSMHRWLCAVYVPPSKMPSSPQHLVCGDRAGSLHLYTLDEPKAQSTLQGVHGRNGVTSLLCRENGIVYSSGRDGYVRSLRVCEGCLLPLTVTRVSGSSWVSRLITVQGKLLAVCFHGIKLKLWSVEEEQTLLEVECGGAHRSWDLRVCRAQRRLACAFLKDGVPYTFSASLSDKLLPLIRPALNTQETMDLKVLFQHKGETVSVTAGEDTTLRLHSLGHQGQRQTLSVVRSHLSGVRTLCLVEGTNGTKNNSDTVWLVSAGGRAEFKVWESSVSDFSEPPSNSMCDSSPCALSPGLKHSVESYPSSFQPPCVTLREVGSHMLRTGCHKTWRSQHVTMDPETRYMGATAFWISSSQALVALASSDGFLRMFLSECGRLREVCAVECSSCLLSVTQLKVSAGPILVTCSTRGHVTFWNLQAVVDWSLQLTASEDISHIPPQSPQPQQLTSVAAHQSGVNALAFYHNKDDLNCVTMATGGDDNKLSVWEVTVTPDVEVTVTHRCSVFGHAAQVSGLSWLSRNYLISASIDQRLIVWKFCDRKDENLPKESTVLSETSRKDDTTEEHHLLAPVDCCFTGVPDVKGVVVTDVSNSEQLEHKIHAVDKRIFVYGMGLQVFDVSVGSL